MARIRRRLPSRAPAVSPPRTGGRPAIDLSAAPGGRQSWDRSPLTVYLWSAAELLLVYNPWQPSSRLRAATLRAFGATVGRSVILRPRLRVRFPWKLSIGDRSWIGEDVWLHNQDLISIGPDVVISQGTFVTTGTHAYRGDMALVTRAVSIEEGVWVTARCTVLAGSTIGANALVTPHTVVRGTVPPGTIFGAPEGAVLGPRWPDPTTEL